jgi:hypothetical protein
MLKAHQITCYIYCKMEIPLRDGEFLAQLADSLYPAEE